MWSRFGTIQKQTPTLVPFSCLIQLRAIDLAYNRRDSAKCDLVLIQKQTPTLVPFSCTNQVARYWFGVNWRDSTKCDLILVRYKNKRQLEYHFRVRIKLRAIDLAYNRRDSAKCDLVLDDTKQTPTLVPFSCINPVARYWFGYNRRDSTKCDLVLLRYKNKRQL